MITVVEIFAASELLTAAVGVMAGRGIPFRARLTERWDDGYEAGWVNGYRQSMARAMAILGPQGEVSGGGLRETDLVAGSAGAGEPAGLDGLRAADRAADRDPLPPAVRDPEPVADPAEGEPPGEAWEPADTDLIRLQAGHHYDPPGPDAGSHWPVPIAACPADVRPVTGSHAVKADPSGPGVHDEPDVLGLMPDPKAFAMIRWDLAHMQDNLWSGGLTLPGWERQAA